MQLGPADLRSRMSRAMTTAPCCTSPSVTGEIERLTAIGSSDPFCRISRS